MLCPLCSKSYCGKTNVDRHLISGHHCCLRAGTMSVRKLTGQDLEAALNKVRFDQRNGPTCRRDGPGARNRRRLAPSAAQGRPPTDSEGSGLEGEEAAVEIRHNPFYSRCGAPMVTPVPSSTNLGGRSDLSGSTIVRGPMYRMGNTGGDTQRMDQGAGGESSSDQSRSTMDQYLGAPAKSPPSPLGFSISGGTSPTMPSLLPLIDEISRSAFPFDVAGPSNHPSSPPLLRPVYSPISSDDVPARVTRQFQGKRISRRRSASRGAVEASESDGGSSSGRSRSSPPVVYGHEDHSYSCGGKAVQVSPQLPASSVTTSQPRGTIRRGVGQFRKGGKIARGKVVRRGGGRGEKRGPPTSAGSQLPVAPSAGGQLPVAPSAGNLLPVIPTPVPEVPVPVCLWTTPVYYSMFQQKVAAGAMEGAVRAGTLPALPPSLRGRAERFMSRLQRFQFSTQTDRERVASSSSSESDMEE
jgi:hypothetical protein